MIPAAFTLGLDPMSYPFVQTDAGRSNSRRPHQKEDCSVRAYAHVLDLPYDEAYDIMLAAGRKSHGRFDIRRVLDGDPRFRWISFPAVPGQPRMNPGEFSRRFPQGRFILRTAKHYHAVIDGVHHDMRPIAERRCVYGAWQVV